MDLERALDELYAGPLEGFTAARNALAQQLKAAGDGEGAKRVKALPKPVVTAWAVNVVVLQQPALLRAVEAAGDEVRRAQVQGVGAAALQAAVAARRERLNEALQAAAEVLRAAGHAATPATLERVGRTFEALAAYGESRPQPPAGRLAHDVEPPGFEVLAGLALRPVAAPGASGAPPSVEAPPAAGAPVLRVVPPPEPPTAAPAALERSARLARLRARLRETADALEQARAAHAGAEREAKDLELRAAQARARADALLTPVESAQAAHQAARAALDTEEGGEPES